MDKHIIGIRLHDVNQGLVVVSGGLINRYYRPTKLMCAVAQISELLAGQQQVKYEKLLVAVGELGMRPRFTYIREQTPVVKYRYITRCFGF